MTPRYHHKDHCTGSEWHYSGTGYNRVRVCSCGAEDHYPDTKTMNTNQSNIYRAIASDVATVSVAGIIILTSILTALWILKETGAI